MSELTTKRIFRAAILLALSIAYLFYVFRVADPQSRTRGLGDWIDPYVINALLEHWHHVVRTFADPSSPPMYFPARHTLGYSHGLVLYAPVYVLLRVFLHPFHADTMTLFLVMEAGALSLYCLLRTLGLPFGAALLLSAFFLTSENVVNGWTGVWTQRASVFLIPPILLLLVTAWRRRGRPSALVMAGAGGCLATLMYVQDFYTAHFAFLFALTFAAAAAVLERGDVWTREFASLWRRLPRVSRTALVIGVAAAAWTAFVLTAGGGVVHLFGVRLAARGWQRPAVLAVLAMGIFAAREWRLRETARSPAGSWWIAAGLGAAIGAAVFLWIYLGPFLEHPSGFSREEVQAQLADSQPFRSLRTFVLVFAAGALAWVPMFRVSRKARLYSLFLAAVSCLVLLVPLRLDGFSLWTGAIQYLPGFGAIRDPKRIIYLYELAAVLAIAFVTTRPGETPYRTTVWLVALVLLLTSPNRQRFDYERPIDDFDRWVAAPIEIDPSCRSFSVLRASAAYAARSKDTRALYATDATFVALQRSIPTLNGYSAWAPDGWNLYDPHTPGYLAGVEHWIERNRLDSVCELDIDARTMRPHVR